jgi:hypothetical protein
MDVKVTALNNGRQIVGEKEERSQEGINPWPETATVIRCLMQGPAITGFFLHPQACHHKHEDLNSVVYSRP